MAYTYCAETYVHVLYSSASLFVFKMETPNPIPSPADSVFKVSEKIGPNQILKSPLNLYAWKSCGVKSLNLLFKIQSKIISA